MMIWKTGTVSAAAAAVASQNLGPMASPVELIPPAPPVCLSHTTLLPPKRFALLISTYFIENPLSQICISVFRTAH